MTRIKEITNGEAPEHATPAVPAPSDTPAPPPERGTADTAARLVQLLDSATRADLVELDMDIEEAEARVRALRELRKLIQLRLGIVIAGNGSKKKEKPPGPVTGNGKPPGKPGPPPSPDIMTRRRNAAVFLHRNGPAGMAEIQRAIKCDNSQTRHALSYPWFEQLPSGNYSLTLLGIQEAIDPDED